MTPDGRFREADVARHRLMHIGSDAPLAVCTAVGNAQSGPKPPFFEVVFLFRYTELTSDIWCEWWCNNKREKYHPHPNLDEPIDRSGHA